MVGGGLGLPLVSEPGPSSPVLAHCGASNNCLFLACGSLIKVRQISPLATLIAEVGREVKNISCGMNNKSGSSFFSPDAGGAAQSSPSLGERGYHCSPNICVPNTSVLSLPGHLHSTLSDALALLRVQLPKGTWKWGAFQKQVRNLPGCSPHPELDQPQADDHRQVQWVSVMGREPCDGRLGHALWK